MLLGSLVLLAPGCNRTAGAGDDGGADADGDADCDECLNLAEGWEASEDSLSWTFFLSPDRKMEDGTPYTAEVVYEVFILQEQGYLQIDNFAGSEIIDDFTILLVLHKPNPEFLQQVAALELPQ